MSYTVPRFSYRTEEDFLRDFERKLPRDEAPDEVCDFCCRGAARWTYPCRSFVMSVVTVPGRGQVPNSSQGAWAACEACSAAVEAGDLDELARLNLEPDGKDMRAAPTLIDIWRRFLDNRTGPRVDSAWLHRTCPHPREALELNRNTLGSLNPRHHTGVICTLCGATLVPELYHVTDGWHRSAALRVGP